MKKFLVFAGYAYYPAGGWDDFVGDADSLEEAKTLARDTVSKYETSKPWWHVADTEAKQVVLYHYQDERSE